MNVHFCCMPPRRWAAIFAVSVAIIGVVSGCGAGSRNPAHSSPVPLPKPTTNTQQISRENLAYLWPLTADHGTIECRAGNQAVFVAPDGKAYALNDTAKAGGAADIAPLQATGADHSKISLGALRSKALELCNVVKR
jgi:hypothetical protein